MDVLIKGLALPKKGESCINLKIYSDGTVYEIGMYSGEIIPNKAKAIELPPHGRLIDADKVKEKQKHSYNEFCENVVSVFDIDHAPTVLEANDGSDN